DLCSTCTRGANGRALIRKSCALEGSASIATIASRPRAASVTAKRPTPAYKSTIGPSPTCWATVETSRGSKKRFAWKNDDACRRSRGSVPSSFGGGFTTFLSGSVGGLSGRLGGGGDSISCETASLTVGDPDTVRARPLSG